MKKLNSYKISLPSPIWANFRKIDNTHSSSHNWIQLLYLSISDFPPGLCLAIHNPQAQIANGPFPSPYLGPWVVQVGYYPQVSYHPYGANPQFPQRRSIWSGWKGWESGWPSVAECTTRERLIEARPDGRHFRWDAHDGLKWFDFWIIYGLSYFIPLLRRDKCNTEKHSL